MDVRRATPASLVTLVTELIRAQFPQWAQLPVRPVADQGNDNRTFRLGEALSVRLPSAEPYAAAIAKEAAWLPVLAPHLPLPIPEPVALGEPNARYPWRWSVNRWLPGESLLRVPAIDLVGLSTSLAGFLRALQSVDPNGGPVAGAHSFFRGAPLAVYDRATRDAIAVLRGTIDAEAATALWEDSLSSSWQHAPVWFHGDIASPNLVVSKGTLAGIIDFGCVGIGDPACDLAIAWTLFAGESRAAFRDSLPLDRGTWARARGWALWKALIVQARMSEMPAAVRPVWITNSTTGRSVLGELLEE